MTGEVLDLGCPICARFSVVDQAARAEVYRLACRAARRASPPPALLLQIAAAKDHVGDVADTLALHLNAEHVAA